VILVFNRDLRFGSTFFSRSPATFPPLHIHLYPIGPVTLPLRNRLFNKCYTLPPSSPSLPDQLACFPFRGGCFFLPPALTGVDSVCLGKFKSRFSGPVIKHLFHSLASLAFTSSPFRPPNLTGATVFPFVDLLLLRLRGCFFCHFFDSVHFPQCTIFL